MNTHINAEHLAWLESRKKGIGGSDVAAILGLSKYKSPYQLWLDKTGRTEIEDTQSEPAYWGNELENVVAKEFQKRTGLKVQKFTKTIVHPDYDFARANIDRAVINPEISGNVRLKKDGGITTDHILECKTANQYLAKLWGDDVESVPDYYLTQCQWYMGITRTQKCSLAVLIGGQKFLTYQIAYDHELFMMLIEECGKFWHEHVLADVPPAPSTFDDVTHRWSKHDPDTSIDDYEVTGMIEEYKELSQIKNEADEGMKTLKTKIGTHIQDKEIVLNGDKRIATFKYQERTTIDSKALKTAHPELFEQFSKTSSTRVLRIN